MANKETFSIDYRHEGEPRCVQWDGKKLTKLYKSEGGKWYPDKVYFSKSEKIKIFKEFQKRNLLPILKMMSRPKED